MDDLISRQAAIDALGELPTFTQDWSYNTWMYTDDVYNAIKELPPIQPNLLQPWEVLVAQAVLPQPKRGKWIEDKGQQTLMQNFIERGEVWRVCSVCGAGHMIGHKYESDKAYHETYHNFCPNCGAKMEGTT